MAISEKLAVRTYPGLQELYSRLQTSTKNFIRINDPNTLQRSTKGGRRNLFLKSFDIIASLLEEILIDTTLSADARITLQTALGSPQYFAAVFLPHFYELGLLQQLCDTKQHIEDAYSQYSNFFTKSSSYLHLRSRWCQIHLQKAKLQKLVRHITGRKLWKRVIIHRVNVDEDEKSLEGKRVVFDPTDPNQFPEEHFVHVHSKTAYIVDSTSTQVEFHLFVSKECTLTNEEIKSVLVQQDESSYYLLERWFMGAHVVNLDKIRPIREWMNSMVPILEENVKCRRHVKRSAKREHPNVAKKEGSWMVAVGENLDQNGHLRPAHNTANMKEEARFDLMQGSDQILDGVVFVRQLLCSN